MNIEIWPKIVRSLPNQPGIYLFHGKLGNILYIGKARDLKKRLGSYFRQEKLDDKSRRLLNTTARIETRITGSEVEALLLEVALIKKHRPPFNVQLKDGKNYAYIRISRDEFPKVEKVRTADKAGDYFGPFPLENVERILKDLRYYFPYRDCSSAKYHHFQKLDRPCLYGDLGLCPAPCCARIDKDNYRKKISLLKLFIQGKRSQILKKLQSGMKLAAKNEAYEKAADFRDTLARLNRLRAAESILSNRHSGSQISKELTDLAQLIGLGNKKAVTRIEAYDISNISGKLATGAMVVFTAGLADKSGYRRFRIRGPSEPNDYRMMQELLSRRLANNKLGPLPDLILIDGGKGQQAIAEAILKERSLTIPVLALAKRKEEVYLPLDGRGLFRRRKEVKNTPAGYLLQRIRDESHRFAHAYFTHLKRREMRELFDRGTRK